MAVPRAKHYFEAGHFYHLTTRTAEGIHLFIPDDAKKILIGAVSFYRQQRRWRVCGFVIMSNHIHLVVQAAEGNLGETVAAFKRWTAGQLTNHGTVRQGVWERRFDDNAVLDPTELRGVIEYDHFDPVRAGVVARPEDYFWSIARNYAGLSPVAMKIDRGW